MTRPPVGFRAKYEKMLADFWRLQQLEQTPEEAEYAKLCMELEGMIKQFREELETLERQNLDLQTQLEDTPDMETEYKALREEQAYLTQLKADLNRTGRK